MSVTLMTMKNGTPTPIKLSIWDAFKGAPPPKPRPQRCSCCNTFHKPGLKPEAPAPPAPPAPAASTPDEKDAAHAAKPDGAKQENAPIFTEEEDARLKELKNDGKFQWAKAAVELGKSVEELKARWKLIKPPVGDSILEAKEEKENEGKKVEGGAQAAKLSKKEKKAQRKNSEQEEQKIEDAKPEAVAAEEKKEPAADAEPAKPAQTTADEKRRWEKAAAKHFDRTGQRITAEQARKMAEAAT